MRFTRVWTGSWPRWQLLVDLNDVKPIRSIFRFKHGLRYLMSHNPQFDQALREWLDGHQSDPNGVRIVDIGGRQVVVKRRHPTVSSRLIYLLRYVRSWTLSLICRMTLGEWPSARVLLRNGVDEEAVRMAALYRAGCHVPEILHHEPGLLVISYAGQDMPYMLRKSQGARERLEWVMQVAQDLAKFHQAGFVHGGAQIRNVMWQDGVFTRIDFEENIGEALSRPLGQAYDVYQMISSMAGMRGIPANELPILCEALLRAYRASCHDQAVLHQIGRMGRAMGALADRTRPLLKRLPGRDVRGFLISADTLRL